MVIIQVQKVQIYNIFKWHIFRLGGNVNYVMDLFYVIFVIDDSKAEINNISLNFHTYNIFK